MTTLNKGQRAVEAVRDCGARMKGEASLEALLAAMMKGASAAVHFTTPDPRRDDNVLVGAYDDGSYAVAIVGGHNGLDVFSNASSDVAAAFAMGAATALGLERVKPGEESKFVPPGLDMPGSFSKN